MIFKVFFSPNLNQGLLWKLCLSLLLFLWLNFKFLKTFQYIIMYFTDYTSIINQTDKKVVNISNGIRFKKEYQFTIKQKYWVNIKINKMIIKTDIQQIH